MRLALGGAGDLVIAGVAARIAGAELPVADAIAEAQRGIAFVGVVAARYIAAQAQPRRDPVEQAVVDDVDDTGRGATAVNQRGGPLEHFDTLCRERVDGDGVVGADGRCVHRAQSIAQHLHARAALAADHRPTDTGAEAGIGDAGPLGEHIADGALAPPIKRLSRQHIDGLDQLLGALPEGAGDDDGLELGRRFLGLFRADQGKGKGQGASRQRDGRQAEMNSDHGILSRWLPERASAVSRRSRGSFLVAEGRPGRPADRADRPFGAGAGLRRPARRGFASGGGQRQCGRLQRWAAAVAIGVHAHFAAQILSGRHMLAGVGQREPLTKDQCDCQQACSKGTGWHGAEQGRKGRQAVAPVTVIA